MDRLPELSTGALDALHALRRSLAPGQTVPLDSADPVHRAAISTVLAASGHDDGAFPQLHRALHYGGPAGAPGNDRISLVDAGKTETGVATATTWTASDGDIAYSGGSTFAFDGTSGELVAHGENTAPGQGFLNCPTRGATARPAAEALDVLHVGHVVDRAGGARFLAMGVSAAVGNGIQATIAAPVLKPGSTHPAIEIAVGRTSYPIADADYAYVEVVNTVQPYLIVPFVGNVTLSADIVWSQVSAANLTTNVIMIDSNGQSVMIDRATAYTTDTKLLAAFTVNGNALSWKFPFDGWNAGGKSYQNTNSIVYVPSSIASEVVSYFYFAFTIPLTVGPAAIFYVCSKNSPEMKSLNCTEVGDLMFWFHCAKAGTMVRLEDGSEIAIETVTNDHRVRGVDGNGYGVRATKQGQHPASATQTGATAVYAMTTGNGRSLTATGEHTLALGDGAYRRICDLDVGDLVLTDEGPSPVETNGPVDSDDVFYSLALGTVDELAEGGVSTGDLCFFTNGIASADHETMRRQSERFREDLDFVLPRLHPDLHADYASALRLRRF